MKLSLKKPKFIVEACEKKKRGLLWIIEVLIFFAIFIVASTIQSFIIIGPQLYYIFTNEKLIAILEGLKNASQIDINSIVQTTEDILTNSPSWLTIINLFSTAAIILVTLLYCKVIEKRPLRTLGLTKNRILSEYLLGLLVGFILFGGAVLIESLTGAIKITGLNPEIHIGYLLLFFVGFIVQGASEEILCRGYLMVSLSKRYRLIIGIIINSAIFACLHLLNSGITLLAVLNLFLFGVFASIYAIKRGNLWGVCAVHSIWNFAQGNIFGIEVSGLNCGTSIFISETNKNLKFINGGTFGAEGGIAVTIMLLLGITVLLFIKGKDCIKES